MRDLSARERDRIVREIGAIGTSATAMGASVTAGATRAGSALTRLAAIGGGLKSALAFAGIGGGLAVTAAALRSAGRDAVGFEKAMAEVSTLLPGQERLLGGLTDQVTRLSLAYGRAPVEQARELYNTISAGYSDSADAVAILDASNKLALGGNADLASSFNAINATLKPFRRNASEASQATDELFTAIRLGKTTAAELGAALPQAAANLAGVGLSAQESLAAIAALTTSGLGTSDAATRINAFSVALTRAKQNAKTVEAAFGVDLSDAFRVSQLQARGLAGFIENLSNTIDSLGLSVDDKAGVLTSLFGTQEGAQAYQLLSTTLFDTLKSSITEIENSAGAASDAVAKMDATTAQKLAKLGVVWDSLAASAAGFVVGPSGELAEFGAGFLTTLAGGVEAASEGFTQLSASAWLGVRAMIGLEGSGADVAATLDILEDKGERARRALFGLRGAADDAGVEARNIVTAFERELEGLGSVVERSPLESVSLFDDASISAMSEAKKALQALADVRSGRDAFLIDVSSINVASEAAIDLVAERKRENDALLTLNETNLETLRIDRERSKEIADQARAERELAEQKLRSVREQLKAAPAPGQVVNLGGEAGGAQFYSSELYNSLIASANLLKEESRDLSEAEAAAMEKQLEIAGKISAIEQANISVRGQSYDLELRIEAIAQQRDAQMALRAEQERQSLALAQAQAAIIEQQAADDAEIARIRAEIAEGSSSQLALARESERLALNRVSLERALLQVQLDQARSEAEREVIQARINALAAEENAIRAKGREDAAKAQPQSPDGGGGGYTAPSGVGNAIARAGQGPLADTLGEKYQAYAQAQDSLTRGLIVLEHVAEGVFDSIARHGTDAILAWINGTKSAEDAWRDFGVAVLQEIQRIIVELLVAQAIAAVTAALTGGGSIAGGAAAGAVAHEGGHIGHDSFPVRSFHDGGAVRRYHSGGRAGLAPDEVPAILQKGEYVVSRRGVETVGPDALDAINSGRTGARGGAPESANTDVDRNGMTIGYVPESTFERGLRSPSAKKYLRQLIEDQRSS